MNSDSDEDFGNYSEEEVLNCSMSSEDDSFDVVAEKYLKVLNKCFGHQTFRPMQWNIINTALNHKRDQCVVMATGSGKSLCFQYPSVYTGGCTIVVSPLISLMEDQVLSLKVAGIPACFLGSAQKNSAAIIDEILENKYRLIYLTPEYCTGDSGDYLFDKMRNIVKFTLIAIDEAHCISKWGHDFRSCYRKLGKLRSLLPKVPIMAVTATASEKVQKDICKALKMSNPKLRCTGFDRPNLYFEILPKGPNIAESIRPYLAECGNGSTIIYTLTKKEAENICVLLNREGILCEAYHAGLTIQKRREVHELFTKDEIKIIVATIAFGMGIDKPDVRLVVHYGASKDMESYYQEVGRAGRDGLPAKCVTFFSTQDFVIHSFLRKESSISNHLDEIGKKMKNFLYSTECRRKLILSYFTEKKLNDLNIQNNFCCDNCTKKKTQPSLVDAYTELDNGGKYDFTTDCKLLLEAIEAMNGKYGLGMYIKFLRGSKMERIKENLRQHKLYGAGSKRTEDWWKIIGRLLEENSFLAKKKFMSAYTIELSEKGQKYLENIQNSKKLNVMKLIPPADVLPFLKRKRTYIDVMEDDDDPPIVWKTKTSQNTEEPSKEGKTPKYLPEIQPICVQPTQSTRTQPAALITFTQGPLKLYEDNCSVAEKEYNTKLFTDLKQFRNQIAQDSDCRPYMVASDTALMEMVHLMPITLLAFKKAKLNSFNETKIERFGPKFVNFLQTFLQKHGNIQDTTTATGSSTMQERLTLASLLAKYPNEKYKALNGSMTESYHLFVNGKTLTQIAAERSLAVSTISFHITSSLANGCPIKLDDLSLPSELCQTIVKAILKLPVDNLSEIKLTTLKEILPDVEYNDLRFVLKYLEIREYAESLQMPYVDHDPDLYKFYKNLKTQRKLNESSASKDHENEFPQCRSEASTSRDYENKLPKNSSKASTSKDAENEFPQCSSKASTPKDAENNLEGLSKADLELINVLKSLAEEAEEDASEGFSDTDLLQGIEMQPVAEVLPLDDGKQNQVEKSSIICPKENIEDEAEDEDELLRAPTPPLLSARNKRKSEDDDDDESMLTFRKRR